MGFLELAYGNHDSSSSRPQLDWETYIDDKVSLLATSRIATADLSGIEKILKIENDAGYDFCRGIQEILSKSQPDTVYIESLKAIEYFLIGDTLRYQYFLSTEPERQLLIRNDLEKLCSHDNIEVATRSIYVFSLLIYHDNELFDNNLIVSLLADIFEHLYSSNSDEESTADPKSSCTLSLSVLLRNSRIRNFLVDGKFKYMKSSLRLVPPTEEEEKQAENEDSFTLVQNITELLTLYKDDPAVLYHLLVSLWVLSFEDDVKETLFTISDLSIIIKMCTYDQINKIIRIILFILHNLLDTDNKYRIEILSEVLITFKFLETLDSLGAKKNLIADVEVATELEWVHRVLNENYKVLTTFDRHEKELLTLKLSWSSSVHTAIFWKENARMFEKDNFSSIKKLIHLLGSEDVTTLAIACYDIGQFVQYYPKGKLIVENLGGKTKIMKLLQHESGEVQKQALTACSKIMISNWKSVAT